MKFLINQKKKRIGSDYPLKLNPETSAMFRPYNHSASGSPASGGLLPGFFGSNAIHAPKNLKNHLDTIDRKMRNTSAGSAVASAGGGSSTSLMPPWFLHQQPNKNKRRQLSESASGLNSLPHFCPLITF